jgi:hypothetical protein
MGLNLGLLAPCFLSHSLSLSLSLFLSPLSLSLSARLPLCVQAPGGDWLFHRCCVRLGVPLTAAPGMHQVDMNEKAVEHFAQRLLDVVERHPVTKMLHLF